MVYLSAKHRQFLEQAIYLLERKTDAITYICLYISAVADRLCLMARRRLIFPDECEDVKIALCALKLDHTDLEVNHPLIDLYYDLTAMLVDDGASRYLSYEESALLVEAARNLDGRQDSIT